MKSMKITGLCLAAMLVVSLATAATASAASWQQCREGTEKVTPTKYTEKLCLTAAGGNAGKWQWKELTTTEKVEGRASLKLADTKGGANKGNAEVECTGKEIGTIGPKEYDRVLEVKEISCRSLTLEECPETLGAPEAEARNLPWQTKLREEANGEKRDEITSEVTGKEAGWKVTCSLLVSDECVKNGATAAATNLQSEGAVKIQFDEKTENAVCTRTKEATGRVRGQVRITSTEGWAVRVQ